MTEKEKRRKYRERRRNDPIRHAHYLEKRKEKRKEKQRLNRLLVLEKRKQSPYWQRNPYERYYKHSPLKKLARWSSYRSRPAIKSFDLWKLAKKQKLICVLTGEKLTFENISLDHIIPVSKGGTNNISNLQLVTRHANTIKNNMNMDELLLLCRKIVERCGSCG